VTGPAPKRWFVFLAVFALVGAACGQYGNVHENATGTSTETGATSTSSGTSTGLGSFTSTGTGTAPTGGGGSLTTTGGGASISGNSTTTTGTSTSSSGGTTTTSGSQTGGSTGTTQEQAPTGGSSVGVTASTITIGIHAPLTGAAPVRQDSFQAGKDLYWKYGDNGKPVKIFGRTVNVVFEDDHYNPSYAQSVCQKMVEQQHVFMIIGGAGADQIVACARYAASRGVPYISAGVAEAALRGLDNYFAISASYPYQSTLLAQRMKHEFHVTDGSNVVMIAEDTPNFDDAVDAFSKALPGADILRVDKEQNGSTIAPNLCTGTIKNYDFVYPLFAPVHYLEMVHAAECHPKYLGIGLTQGIDAVARLGCPDTAGAQFFNPSPAWVDRQKFDPGFEKAIAAGKTTDDDIVWLLWGLMKTVGQLLENAGKNLTREGFIYSTERASVHSGVYPDLHFSPTNHFGANQVHVIENVCSGQGHYVTKAAFKSKF
jgi:branched-chain amino acid transport system substrate-binding protein